MYCQKCGVQIPEGSTFCSSCGAAQQSAAPKEKIRKISASAVRYIILAIIGILLLIFSWPVALVYCLAVGMVLSVIRLIKKKKLPAWLIVLTVVPVIIICLIRIGGKMPDKQLTRDDYITAAEAEICKRYKDANLNPEMQNVSVTDVGNSEYQVSGTMSSAFGGFEYSAAAIIEVSPDNTEYRVVNIQLVQVN